MALEVGGIMIKLSSLDDGFKKGLEKAKKELAGVGDETEKTEKKLNKLDKVGNLVANSFKFALVGGLTMATAGFVALGVAGFNNSVMIQEAMADVRKSVGLTTEETDALRDAILNIGPTTRTAVDDLIGIAKIGGQIGVAKEEILDFTLAIDKVSVALGDEFTGGAEEVTSKLGTLKTLFSETSELTYADAMLKVGSAINSLGASGSATGPEMAEFTARIGQLGNLAPSITQTLGLGAAMQELGLSAEISSGGLTNIFLTAGNKSEKFAKQLGMSEQAFKDLFKASPNDMLLQLADSFKGIANDPVVLAQKMSDLGISSQESIKVMSLLANKTDLVKDKQALAAGEFAKGTSIIDEYNIKNNTMQAIFGKAQNLFTKFTSSLFNADIGSIGESLSIFLSDIDKFFTENGPKIQEFAEVSWKKLTDGFQWTIDNWPLIQSVLVGIGTTLGILAMVYIWAVVIPALGAMAVAGWAAIAPWLPFIAIAVAVGAIVAWLYYEFTNNFEGIKWLVDTVVGFVVGKWDEMAKKAIEIKDSIVNAFNFIQSGIGNALKGAVNALIDNLNYALSGWNNVIRSMPEIPGLGRVPEIPTIPKFAKGVRNFEGGPAIINEKGAEALKIGDLTYLPQGTDVIKARETREMQETDTPTGNKIEKHYHFHFEEIVFADEKSMRNFARKFKKIAQEEGI